jgi:hypothetical protein
MTYTAFEEINRIKLKDRSGIQVFNCDKKSYLNGVLENFMRQM